ncbi:MAG TPA: SDR family NAD(P)-dependent oxidoreductase [Vicinamibacterales bacterium]
MQMTIQQKRGAAIGAAAIGALLVARSWHRRDRYDFGGKSVLITGGSRGLGLVMARNLAAEGAKLTLVARDEEELDRAVKDIQSREPLAAVAGVSADIRRRYDAERAVAQAIDGYGRIDVLVNNAGIVQVGPLDHMTLSDYEDAMNTHFWGPLYAITAALPHMRREGEGRIVNISSIGAKIAIPHLVPYSASKFALAGLSEGLRAELAGDNIIVTTVYPGLMRTGSPVQAMFKGKRPQEYAWFAISDSLPLASIDAGRAAHQIINACRYGRAELIITAQAKLAVLAKDAAPELFADVMAFISGMLPLPVPGSEGDTARPGRESESGWAARSATLAARTYRAARQNNEL